MSFRSYWVLYRTSHCRLRIVRTLTACSLSALAWFWCPTFVRHQRWLYKQSLSSCSSALHWCDEAQKAETVPSVVRYRSMSFRSYWVLYRTTIAAYALCARSLLAVWALWHGFGVSHLWGIKGDCISSHFRPAHQHYTDEAHKAEMVPSVVRYRSMSFRSYWALYRTSHCRLRIVRTLTACSLSALAWFWCPTFVRHQRWLYKQSLSSCSSALHWWGPKRRNGTVCS